MDELSAWLILHRTPGLGARGLQRLLERFGGPLPILGAGRSGWSEEGLKDAALDWLARPDLSRIQADLAWLEQPGNRLLLATSDDYPELLRQLPDPPPLLFVCGDAELLHLPQLALVGSRNPSPSGERTARQFARYLAERGLCITSGLALGIDGASHQGALDAGGHTLAVMGTGVDRIYPPRHRDLAHAIVQGGGALVSEFPLGCAPQASNFPRRNRIITGLSLGVLVVEAALKSGSLISARLANEQGREVFAIPGSIHNSQARGCHFLIKNGAKLVETAQDIVEELAPLLGSLLVSGQAAQTAPDAPTEMPADHRQLLDQMGFDPISVDQLVALCGLRVEEVASMLLLLELEGHVSSVPGGLYCRLH
ncbi:MAG: DNA-processing protein DprA [Gammaproteobacteria bacterium SHHR-1]|uniref:DNA-processing protein DprA n=1 Tax=Magnetovirga frankeli TaxID=947516 RepID=UPI00129336D7|nr:DNA-protecting protein DprA [gamma proteobacterium SS-5]